MAEEMKPMKKITLQSSDGEEFEVDEVVAFESELLKHMIEGDCANNVIPLDNVDGDTLYTITEYCKRRVEFAAKSKGSFVATTSHGGDTGGDDDVVKKAWDDDISKLTKDLQDDQHALFDLLQAADYLNIKSLLDFTTNTVADMMRGKTPEEIRKTFNIVNDYTPEEEKEVREENLWAFEGLAGPGL